MLLELCNLRMGHIHNTFNQTAFFNNNAIDIVKNFMAIKNLKISSQKGLLKIFSESFAYLAFTFSISMKSEISEILYKGKRNFVLKKRYAIMT